MQWNIDVGEAGEDCAYSVIQTSDGGYAIAGVTNSSIFGKSTHGGYDAVLMKTDPATPGIPQWCQTYGGAKDDVAYAVIQTTDGGYALAGGSLSYGAGGEDFWLVKTNSSGNMQWNQTYGGTFGDWAESVVQTSDGGYALAGSTYSYGIGSGDFWLVKTDSLGYPQWSRIYGGTSNDQAFSVVQTSDGGYALAGSTDSFTSLTAIWLIKTDASGNQGECGLTWVGSTPNSIKLYRGPDDSYWNYVRVQIWQRK